MFFFANLNLLKNNNKKTGVSTNCPHLNQSFTITPFKFVRRGETVSTVIKIVGPPLQHFAPFLHVLRLINIGGANVVTLLVTHLTLYSFPRPFA